MALVYTCLTDADVAKFRESVLRDIEALKGKTPAEVLAKLKAEGAPGLEDEEVPEK